MVGSLSAVDEFKEEEKTKNLVILCVFPAVSISFLLLFRRRKSLFPPPLSHPDARSFPLELSQFSGLLVSFPVAMTKSSDQTWLPVGGIVHHGWEDMAAGA